MAADPSEHGQSIPWPPPSSFGEAVARRRAARRVGSRTPLSSEDYFAAAHELLGERGPAALTINNLCDRVGVTKGSFYYHFQNLDDFVDAFAKNREESSGLLLAAILEQPDPLERLSLAANASAWQAHSSATAIRAWTYSDAKLAASQERVDRMSMDVAHAVVGALEPDPDRAAAVARQLLALAVGLEQLHRQIDPVSHLQTLASFAEAVLGVQAEIITVEDRPAVRFF